MANINTRNVHRSNLLMGFPYGKDFIYDEMVLTGPGEQGEATAKRITAANTAEKMNSSGPKPGEGHRKRSGESGYYDLLFVAMAPDGRQVRASVKGDRDPGYGSTSKMIRGMRGLPVARCAGSCRRHLELRARRWAPN